MGILNMTPDSFSDGGKYLDVDVALARAETMIAEGADILDIGGESSRPGSSTVDAKTQLERVAPLIDQLVEKVAGRVLLSIDTTNATVAAYALKRGFNIVNDISAGRADKEMLPLVACFTEAKLVLMHMQGTPQTMQDAPNYQDVVAETIGFLMERVAVAQKQGIAQDRIIFDPGIGFGKTQQHNLDLMMALPRLVATAFPVLLGTSRKRFMGSICPGVEPTDLVGATAATTAYGVGHGVAIFRVHDVAVNRQAADVAFALTHKSTKPT